MEIFQTATGIGLWGPHFEKFNEELKQCSVHQIMYIMSQLEAKATRGRNASDCSFHMRIAKKEGKAIGTRRRPLTATERTENETEAETLNETKSIGVALFTPKIMVENRTGTTAQIL